MAERKPPERGRAEQRPPGGSAEGRQQADGPVGHARASRANLTGRRGVGTRPERYLVAAAPPADARALAARLDQDAQIAVVRTIGSASAASYYPHIAVIETTAERAVALAREPDLHVEPDQRLSYGIPADPAFAHLSVAAAGEVDQITVRVRDDGGRPVEHAAVSVLCPGFPAIGFTAADGQAELVLPAGAAASATVMLVRPARGCWPTRIIRPELTPGVPVAVVCHRITTTYPDFPEHALDSWGARAMGFDRLPPTHRGSGVRVALVGSGVAEGHPDLADRIAGGRDVVGEDDKSWRRDLLGTGTHEAVLIAGRDDGAGVVGLAPEAAVHVCRAVPGGRASDLIEALDYCIDLQVDVAMISVGIAETSWLLSQKIRYARASGVACIAAAGDSAGPIAYPAAEPGVLAVGAVGQLGSFPADSGHAAHIGAQVAPDGLFVPAFASTGPGLDCCAPGVAIVSGLPPASYGPLDGSGAAAAHVAAAAALILAHHPRFRPEQRRGAAIRDVSRVDHLFQVILAACRPLPFLDPIRSGAGVPDVAVAMGLAPQWPYSAPLMPAAVAPELALAGHGHQATAGMEPLRAAMWSAGLLMDIPDAR
jgi:subtilisin